MKNGILRITSATKVIKDIPLEQLLTLQAEIGASYALIDVATNEISSDLILKKQGDTLVIENDQEVIAQIENFYSEGQAATFEIGALTAAGTTTLITASDTAAEDSHIVWDASDNQDAPAALAGESEGFNDWGLLGAGLVGLAAVTTGAVIAATEKTEPDINNIVEGTIVGGPVVETNDLKVIAYQADGVTVLGEGTVGADGKFSINVGSYTGVVIAKVVNEGAGADYLDEATGVGKDLNAELFSMGVVSTANSTLTLNMNALTTVAYQKAIEQSGSEPLDETTVVTVNAAIAEAFGLTNLQETTITTINGETTFDNTDGLDAGETYGAVLAALSGADKNNGGDSQATIDELVSGITLAGDTATLNADAQETVIDGGDTAAVNAGGETSVIVDTLAPELTSNTVATALNENSGASQVVYTAVATDASQISYSLKTGVADQALFTIDSATGAVTLTADPDFETKPSYSFTVVATDAATNSSEQAVSLAVNNLDEVAPTITSATTATAIDENSGASQVVYTATSTDTADTTTGSTSYSLKTNNSDDASSFSIDSSSGAVTLTADPDFETKASYNFTVVATDAVNNNSEQAVSLAVNNLDEVAPTITSATTATAIDENSGASQVVYTASSTDTGDTATGSTSYSLKTNNSDDASSFSIDSSSGAVTLTADPDFETKASYNFTVVATDAVNNNSEQAVSLAINNLDEIAPIFDTTPPVITAVSIPNVAMNVGDTVTVTLTVDDDASDTYTNLSGTVGGFSLSSLARTNSTTYTAQFTVAEGGTDVAAGSTIPVSLTLDDSVGNTSLSYTIAITQTTDAIDANSPSAPVISTIATNDVVNDSEATTGFNITGTGEVGATVTLSFDSTTTLASGNTATVDGSGDWSIAVADADVTAFAEGSESITATQTDTAGNISVASSAKVINIDTVALAPTINAIASDDTVNDSEASTGVNITGTGEVGATVTLTFDSTTTLASGNTATVDGSGNWTIAVADADVTAFAEGAESITATQTDTAGNTSVASGAKAFTVETVLPTVHGSTPIVKVDTDTSNGYSATDTVTLKFSEAITVASLSLSDISVNNSHSLGTDPILTAIGDQTYTDTFTITLGSGGGITLVAGDTLTVAAASVVDQAGNLAASDLTFTAPAFDTTPPVITAVSIPNVVMNVGDTVTVTLTVDDDAGDTYTNLSGTVGGFSLSSLARTNSTTYTAQFTVAEGGTDVAAGSTIPVSLTLGDSVGNTSLSYTTAITQTTDAIDANSPSAPVIDTVATNDVVNDSEASAGFNITGTGEVGATITLSFDGNPTLASGNTATVDGSGNWSVAVVDADVTAFHDGFETIRAIQTDSTGNESASDAKTITVDTTVPTTTISAIDISTDTGTSATDFETKTASQTITATLSTSLASGEILYGSIDNGANWTDITSKVTTTAISWDSATLSGSSLIAFKVTDAAGNEGAIASQAYVLDTSAPSVSGATTPADNATDIVIGADLSITFDENVLLSSGNITVKNLTDVTETVIDVTNHSSQLSISGSTLTINPSSDLLAGKSYAVQIDSTALTDTAGNDFAGIADDVIWNFDTAAGSSEDTSIVVFNTVANLGNGVGSSAHSGRTFDANISYTIYIVIDSDANSLGTWTDDINPAVRNIWHGADNLGDNDRLILVGDNGKIDAFIGGAPWSALQGILDGYPSSPQPFVDIKSTTSTSATVGRVFSVGVDINATGKLQRWEQTFTMVTSNGTRTEVTANLWTGRALNLGGTSIAKWASGDHYLTGINTVGSPTGANKMTYGVLTSQGLA